MSINIAIIGHGYVGKAVDHGFSTSQVKKFIVDPIYGTTLEELKGKVRLDAAFVAVPTPFGSNGEIDASIVKDVVRQLEHHFSCPIIIKSTTTPDIVDELYCENERVVYNPEFLTEKNALEDFINPPMHVLGGSKKQTDKVLELYENYSQCIPCPVYHMSAKEAAFVKYGINSFLATKVLWMNQFKDIVDDHNAKYNVIVNAIGSDPRIGHSHTQVPGPDGRKGYGGACFPKDTSALSKFARGEFSVLDEVISANNRYRQEYELDDREKEQKVNYG
jgi:nucleotide sugar dehydrogenase